MEFDAEGLADDECDKIGLGCYLEHFTEAEEVCNMINNLKNVYNTPQLEGEYDRLYNLLKKYYEQPHLLDPHLDMILGKFITMIRNKENGMELKQAAFNYMYQIVRIRGYKTVVRHLPHEVSDFQLVLNLLEQQDPNDKEKWRSRFVLLLWLSIIVIIPFHMTRLDGFNPGDKDEEGKERKTVMERILDICKTYATASDACAQAGAFLTSKFITRSDVKDAYLESFIKWACENLHADNITKYGVLAALATVIKHGKREDLLPFAGLLLKNVQLQDFAQHNSMLVKKYYVKIVQRIGMLYLPPRVSAWRYTQGCRSLASNLLGPATSAACGDAVLEAQPEPTEEDVPEQLEEVLELLLSALRERDTAVRWAAAKGIGRVAARLPPTAAAEVSDAVLTLVADDNQLEHASHGGCMALAELARRGLLAPEQLASAVGSCIRVLRRAGRGWRTGGAARDAGAHAAWALARAYPRNLLAPYSDGLAIALITTACFDREINCRRAASASYQENVGRHGLFPHGIEVLSVADFHSVGPRNEAFLTVAPKVASFPEYTEPMIEHLIDLKVPHWDGAIRELSALALNKLTPKAPNFMATRVLTSLTDWLVSDDMHVRHGAVLATCQIVLALSEITVEEKNGLSLVSEEVMDRIKTMVPTLRAKRAFVGLGGELVRSATARGIGLLAAAKLNVHGNSVVDDWLTLLEECLSCQVQEIREGAVVSLPQVFAEYFAEDDDMEYSGVKSADKRKTLVQKYCKQLKSVSVNGLYERMGYARAIGSLPKRVLLESLPLIVESLIECSKVSEVTDTWAESRRDALLGLSKCIQTVGLEPLVEYSEKIQECLVSCLQEYTTDKRGDIGAWVREAAMQASYMWCCRKLSGAKSICPLLARGACEKIDRTRALAAKVFTQFIHSNPVIADIPHHDKLKEIFQDTEEPMGNSKTQDSISSSRGMSTSESNSSTLRQTSMWLFPEHTMTTFIKLLDLDEYRTDVVMGLIVSGGDLTESLVKHTTQALFSYLTTTDAEMLRAFCDTVVRVFADNQFNHRITGPIFPFLDRLLGSGALSPILEESTFAENILKHVQIELKNCKNTYKLLDSINVLCQLIQVGGNVSNRALGQLCVLLCNSAKYVRRSTATRTYEALLLYTDGDTMSKALDILSETDWEEDVVKLRPIRNELCEHLGIKPPLLKIKKTT